MTSDEVTKFLMSSWENPAVVEYRQAWESRRRRSSKLANDFCAAMRDFVEAHDDPIVALQLFLLSRRTM